MKKRTRHEDAPKRKQPTKKAQLALCRKCEAFYGKRLEGEQRPWIRRRLEKASEMHRAHGLLLNKEFIKAYGGGG